MGNYKFRFIISLIFNFILFWIIYVQNVRNASCTLNLRPVSTGYGSCLLMKSMKDLWLWTYEYEFYDLSQFYFL